MTDDAPAPEPAEEPASANGAIAGFAASLIGMPLLGVALVAALFLQRSVLSKVMGGEIEYDSMHHGSTGFMASLVLAGLTGLIGAGVAALIVHKLIKHARGRVFMLIAGAMFAVIAAGVWWWLRQRDPAGGYGFFIAVGWIAALLGLYIGGEVAAEDLTATAPADS